MGGNPCCAGQANEPTITSLYSEPMFVGRDVEIDVVKGVIETGRSGAGSSLLLAGEPGVGKSTLLEFAAQSAHDAAVLRCAGAATERSLPFGGLISLCRPYRHEIDSLPATRRLALLGALRLGPRSDADRLTLFEAVVDLIDLLSGDRPALVLLDDLQWLDPDTSACVDYVIRRLSARRVAVIAATHSSHVIPDAWPNVLEIGPLAVDAARSMLRDRWPNLSASAEAAVLDAARGNPLALIELADLYATSDPSDTVGSAPAHLGRRVRNPFERRLEALPATTRELLLLLAVARTSPTDALATLVERSEYERGDLDPALTTSLLSASRGRVDFTHSLVRTAVAHAASPAQVRAAHQRLGELLDDPAAVWHRAECAVGADDVVADELHAIAVDAIGRSSPSAAAEAFETAAQLTSAEADRAERLLAAGQAAFSAGDATTTVRLLDTAAALSAQAPDRRATAHHLAGLATMWYVSARDGYVRLMAGADHPDTPMPAVARMLADAALAATAWDCAAALALAQQAWEAAAGLDDETRAICGSALMWCLTLRGQARDAATTFENVLPLLGAVQLDGPQAQSLLLALNWRVETEAYASSMEMATAMADAAAMAGAAAGRAGPLIVAGEASRRLGLWEQSRRHLCEALEIARASRQLGAEAMSSASLARLAAAQGDEQECLGAISNLERCGGVLGMDSSHVFGGAARGLLELGMNRPSNAVTVLEHTHEAALRIGLGDTLFVPYLADLIEAHSRLGNRERALALTATLAEMSSRTDAAGALAALARCRGLTNRDTADLDQAIELHDASGMPFERARTLLIQGELLRRERQQAAARTALQEAIDIFDKIGAHPWRLRAQAERAALEGRSGHHELTSQERRIAEAAAGGARNREIAAAMFVSEKTVERHLTAIYRLAGIRSRVALAAWLAASD